MEDGKTISFSRLPALGTIISAMAKRYTVGFVFNPPLTRVLLIHKLTPAWQAGFINGLGGKYEGEETATECIAREVQEEAGLKTAPTDWRHVGQLHGHDWSVDVLTVVYTGAESDAKSLEEQQVEWFDRAALPPRIIANLAWLVPICHDAIRDNQVGFVDVRYINDV